MSAIPKQLPRSSREEYHAVERSNPNTKHEFLDGQILAMAGATLAHVLLTGNVYYALRRRLQPGCTAFTSDLFLLVGEDEFHPDGSVICGPVARDGMAATNPTILVEVTSPSTERYDRETKVPIYQTIPSLRLILIVSHERREVAVYVRHDGEHWSVLVESGDVVVLNPALKTPMDIALNPSLHIPMDELYAGWEDVRR